MLDAVQLKSGWSTGGDASGPFSEPCPRPSGPVPQPPLVILTAPPAGSTGRCPNSSLGWPGYSSWESSCCTGTAATRIPSDTTRVLYAQ